MRQDFVHVVAGAEAVSWSLGEALGDEIFTGCGHIYVVFDWVWEEYLAALYVVVHFGVVSASSVKRSKAHDHLVDEDAKRPPVNCICVSFIIQHLRGKILRRAAKRGCQLVRPQLFRHSKISHAYIAILLHQDVLRLQISIQNLFGMQMPQRHRHLSSIKPCSILKNPLIPGLLQMAKQLTSYHISHHKEYSHVSLKYILSSNQEWMIAFFQYLLLHLGRFDHVCVEYDIFSYSLHGVDFLVFLATDEIYFAESAGADSFQRFEVLEHWLVEEYGGKTEGSVRLAGVTSVEEIV
jgi:hypothetical protein